MDNFYYLAALAAGDILLAGIFISHVRKSRKALAHQHNALSAMREDLRALFDSSVGVGERLQSLEQRYRHEAERERQDTMREAPTHENYTQAKSLVAQGAGVEEIMAACDLSRGEAELVFLLTKMERDKLSPR